MSSCLDGAIFTVSGNLISFSVHSTLFSHSYLQLIKPHSCKDWTYHKKRPKYDCIWLHLNDMPHNSINNSLTRFPGYGQTYIGTTDRISPSKLQRVSLISLCPDHGWSSVVITAAFEEIQNPPATWLNSTTLDNCPVSALHPYNCPLPFITRYQTKITVQDRSLQCKWGFEDIMQ